MADLTAIRNALAQQITDKTGLRALGQAPDSVAPPVAVVLPGQGSLISYADDMSGSCTVSLAVMILVSDGPPADAVQARLDSYLGIGAGETASIPEAIAADPTLSGLVQWAVPVSVTQYGRIQWAGIDGYWGARCLVQVGAL